MELCLAWMTIKMWIVAVQMPFFLLVHIMFPEQVREKRKEMHLHVVWACCSFLWVTEPEKTADISRCHHLFPPEMTSEEREQKFCTDDVSLSRFGFCF